MGIRWKGSLLLLLGAGALFNHASAQTPLVITEVAGCPVPFQPGAITASVGAPVLIPGGITAGTNSASFPLCIFGTFNPDLNPTVKWLDTATNKSITFTAGNYSITAGQLTVNIPQSFYIATAVANTPDQIRITVTENGGLSATCDNTTKNVPGCPFTVNPPLQTGGPVFTSPAGSPTTVALYSFGTPPYTNTFLSGNAPPGMPVSTFPTNSPSWSGTPNTPGQYVFSFGVTDAWGNQAAASEAFYIVPVPHITGMSPLTALVGTGTFSLIISGSGFVAPTTVQGVTEQGVPEPGSTVAFGSSSLTVTAYSANQLTATVPANLLLSSGIFNVAVTNPSPVTSNLFSFQVLPGITGLNPASRTAGTGGFVLQVTGVGFQYGSQILFGDTALTTSFDGKSTLTGTVPASVIANPGAVPVVVANPSSTVSAQVAFMVLPQPVITSLVPNQAEVGTGPAFMAVNGSNFTASMSVNWNGAPLAGAVFNGPTQFSVTVPVALLKVPGNSAVTAAVTVSTVDGFATAPQVFTILPPLTLTTTALPRAFIGVPYNFTLIATGGELPYTWAASGLPPGILFNNGTGTLSGTPTTAGVSYVSVVVKDSTGALVGATLPLAITLPPTQLQISTNPLLPGGSVGTPYSLVLTATGGTPPYSFAILGALPAGLSLSSNGALSGTPTAAGTFGFTAVVSDSTKAMASLDCSLTILASPLTITTGALSNAPTGAPLNIQFAASGGVPPYTFQEFGPLPPGMQFSSSGALTGTPTATGTYTMLVFVLDRIGGSASKSFALTITLPGLIITTPGPLPSGQLGAPYSTPLAATGGKPPYYWTGNFPPGLTIANTTGLVAGIPTQDGTFTIAVTVSDSNPAGVAVTTQNYALTIAPLKLAITGFAVPNGTVGVSYMGSVTVGGGNPPYTVTATGLPPGIGISTVGALGGTPTAAGSYTINVTVKDSGNQTATAAYPVTIAAPLTVTTSNAGTGTLGVAFSAKLAAAGGTPPYVWGGSNLPAGLSLAQDGTLAGTPTAVGTSSFQVTVTDNLGVTAKGTVQVTIALPASPKVTVSLVGLGATAPPASQSQAQVVLGGAYPLAITVKLTMTVTSPGSNDPMYQFAGGGRTATTTIQAGATSPVNSVPLQFGTLPGTVTITAQLLAGTQDITPSPAPATTIGVNATVPVITSMSATRTSSGFTVTITGYSPPQNLSAANFTFNPAPGASLQTPTLTLQVGPMFTTWFQSAASAPYGAQFTWDQPFTVQGSNSAVLSVTVTLTNSVGTSAAATANLQ